jgi:hypothetical protein
MLVGYNTNVPYKGKLYHVQTEDNGTKNPVIVTLLYIKGTILASKKTNYAQLVSSPGYKEAVRELMKEQHKTMIKELIRGVHTGSEPPDTPAGQTAPEETAQTEEQKPEQPKQIAKSLDDILLDYIIKGEQ